MLEHALRVHCSESAQTPVRAVLLEEVRCDGRGVSSGVLQPDPLKMLEYTSPVWANLPEYLTLLVEGVQKKALEIIFPGFPIGMHLCTVVFVLSRIGAPQHALNLSREFGTLASLLTCHHSAQLWPMDTIYVQASSVRIPSWPLLTVSTNLLHIDIPSKMFHADVYIWLVLWPLL